MLARFFLKEIDPKKKNDEHVEVIRELNSLTQLCLTVKIEIALLGIRNFIYNAKKPKVIFSLTYGNQEPIDLPTLAILNTRNPNFGKIVAFEGIQLPFEPLLWPLFEVSIVDEGTVLNLTGCESCFTTLSLFEFAKGILSEEEITYARAQQRKNQRKLTLVQKQIDPTKFYERYLQHGTHGNEESSVEL